MRGPVSMESASALIDERIKGTWRLARENARESARHHPPGCPCTSLFHDLRVCLVDDVAHFRERFPAPVSKSLILSSINAEADSMLTGPLIFSSKFSQLF